MYVYIYIYYRGESCLGGRGGGAVVVRVSLDCGGGGGSWGGVREHWMCHH